MKRRRSSSSGGSTAVPGSSRSQGSRPDVGELIRLLGTAAEGNRSDEIEALAAKGIDLSAPSGSAGLSALHRATLTGSLDALLSLLRAGADPDAPETGAGRTPLHFAALRSDAAAAKALVEAGAHKEARDSDGRTPLHLSCIVMRPTNPVVPLYLLQSGAVGSATDDQGTTALDIAVRYGCAAVVSEIFRPLRKAAATAIPSLRPSRGNMGLLYEAVRGGDASIVGTLVEAGWEAGVPAAEDPLPPEAAEPEGMPPPQRVLPHPPAPSLAPSTPLQDTRASKSSGGNLPNASACSGKRKRSAAPSHAAAAAAVAAEAEDIPPRDSPPTIEVISQASAAPGASDDGGDVSPPQATSTERETLSPLMLAADSGRPDVVRALLRGRQRGFPDAGDAYGYTALHFATMRGSVGIAEALLGMGARAKHHENGGDGDASVGVDLPAAAAAPGGADPNVANADGDTALHIAVATRRTDVGEVLLRAGASVKVANRLGHTALHFAAALGLSGFAKKLLDCGADVAAVDGTRPAKGGSPRKTLVTEGHHGAVKANDVRGKSAAAGCGDVDVHARVLGGSTVAAAPAVVANGVVPPQQQLPDKKRSTRICADARLVAARQQDAGSGRPTRVCVLRAKGAASPSAPPTPVVSLNAKGRPTWGSSPKARFSSKAKPSAPTTPGLRSSPRIRGTPPSIPRSGPRSVSKSRSRSTPKSCPRSIPRSSNGHSHSGGCGAKHGGRGGGGGSVGVAVKERKPKKEGRTPLHYAAMNGRVEATRVLLEAGAPPAHRWNDKRESPLLVAARNGHAEVVALLLERVGPADVDMPAAEGETPLSAACANGHAEVVEKLIRQGADVSRRDPSSHQSSLDLAVAGSACCPSSRSRIVEALLKSNADPDGGGGGSVLGHSTPLHTACRVGGTVGVGAVEALLKGGADPNAPPPGDGGRRLLRPLHIAAVHGNADAVSALTLRGCRLDIKTLDPSRSTPLVLAVEQGHADAAHALIEAGAAIDVVPRREDGSERAPSLARLAADMRRGDMVSLLAKAVVQRDSSETWVREWNAANGIVAGAAASAPNLGAAGASGEGAGVAEGTGGAGGAGGASAADSADGAGNVDGDGDVDVADGVDVAGGVDVADGVDRACGGAGKSAAAGAGDVNTSVGAARIGVTLRPRA